jgi:hypothetical protein
MATIATDRIQPLLELGAADQGIDWPDYLLYGFTEADVPALLELVADETLERAAGEILTGASIHCSQTHCWNGLHFDAPCKTRGALAYTRQTAQVSCPDGYYERTASATRRSAPHSSVSGWQKTMFSTR